MIRVYPTGKMTYKCEYGQGKRITIGDVQVLIEKWRAQCLTKEGVQSLTANKEIVMLKAVLSRAKKWQFVKEHPLADFEMGSLGDNNRVRFLNEVAKISNFTWHHMRHDYASQLVMSGIDLNTVRELLGHADLKMTLRYAHLAPEHKQKAVKILQNRRNEMLNHRKESDA